MIIMMITRIDKFICFESYRQSLFIGGTNPRQVVQKFKKEG
jgi:hypothetical protein